MRIVWCSMALTVLVMHGLPAAAVPPPIYPEDHFGPYVLCPLAGVAVPVNTGESLTTLGRTDELRLAEGVLLLDVFLQDPVRDADIVHPHGNMDVPGLGRVTRYELTSRNSDMHEIGYVPDTGKAFSTGQYSVLIRSALFTGSDTDTAILARVIGGAKAEAMCAQRNR